MESITRQKPLFPGLSILDVPNDIFLCIFDSLDLHDLFILSQTHPRFRNLIKKSVSEWIADVCSLPSNDRLRFWTGLGYTLPDHYVCEGCCRLHRHGIPHQDLGSVFQPQNSGTRHERPTYNPNMIFRGKIDPHVYRHADIQIALKCHMRGLFENQLYKRVMELRRDRFQPGYLYTGNLWSWKSIPKIVSGRFLVAREVKIDAGVGGALLSLHNSIRDRSLLGHATVVQLILLSPSRETCIAFEFGATTGLTEPRWISAGGCMFSVRQIMTPVVQPYTTTLVRCEECMKEDTRMLKAVFRVGLGFQERTACVKLLNQSFRHCASAGMIIRDVVISR
ncbi:hypothetical protein GQ607_004380 [Colletotrichum asianum]|uniref:F-box domain-containing protein n=1 Tax=Colletotrichum asianum TaxID=702518 RepID=A0A8H3WHQ7_9PEZI|nr:hypothetical protein GQ607_004380 [Colletotrichum asianum]